MDCGACGRSNRPGAMFCGGCGSALTSRCSKCDAELEPDLAFCDRCGARVSGEATAPAFSPAAPDAAVRKTVTVLFADLGGSTSFGERTDAELAREVMARYHAILQAVIDAHGGTVAKFMGDGMMATFGIPEIAEDDATRAVHAGTELQRRFQEFAADVADRHGETLTLRVGINTGEVVIADGDADLIGDALNVAARLEKACRPGQVLVGEETWRISRGEFGYEALGEVTVAGRAQPVTIYEVAETEAATAEPVAPFVGRALEMQRLQTAFDRAASSGTAMLVTVLGSPGLGKTRLSRELAQRLAAGSGATTFEIRCDREGEATFAPIAQLIREAADIGDDTEAEASGARERIAALFPVGDADRERLVDVLAGVFGAAPARSVEETFWSIRRLVEVLAVNRPLLVVIDDIQWAESKLLDLLEHLAEWVSNAPVLLLCLARPELRDVRPALAETGRRVADVLALDGLDSAATEELAAGLLGTERLPAGLIERLPTSTDGNPLFVRELVRMLVDDEVIRRRESGEWELTIDADAVEVPPTIQSLLAARVERLPVDERRLLELASVIGAEFSLGALRALAGATVAVPALLEGMRRKELVEPTGTYWGDEPVQRFHHVLIRDAAYRRLLKTTRAELHQRVAVWTDASAANLIGEHEAAIAYHYEQAYAYRRELGTIDADTEEVGRRAAELLSIAAQRALGRDDLTSAGALARRAVAVIPPDDLATRAELLLIGCECFLASGDVAAGSPLVHELSEISAADEKLAAWAVCFEAQLVSLTDPQGLLAADAAATAAATTLKALGDGAGEAKAHQVRAALLARLGRVGDAEAVLDLALGAARAANDRRRVTAVLGAAPVAALFGPSPVARAGGRCLDVVRLLRITTASPSVEATSMRCQAVLEALRGRFDVSRSMLASARASLAELGLRHGLLETDLFAGMVELLADDPGAAIAPLRAAYEGLGTLGVGADAGQAAALLARALLDQGDVDEADRMATASEELAGQNLKTAIAWRVARAEVLAARGDVGAAIALADEAVQIAAATDLILDHADACVALARLREQAGDLGGAASNRAEAQRLYELKGAAEPLQRPRGSEPIVEPPATPVTNPAAARRPVAADARHPYAENASATMLERMWGLIVAERHDEFGSLCTDDVALISHRSLLAEEVHGRDIVLANNRALVEPGLDAARVEVLAVRGSRLSLARVTARFGNGSEIVLLQVAELDQYGLMSRNVFFDEHDLDAAVDELNERYLAGEGAPYAAMVNCRNALRRAVNRGDYEGALACFAPGFAFVDHRSLSWPLTDAEGWIEMTRELRDLISDVTEIVRAIHFVGRAELTVYEMSGTTNDGNRYEWSANFVSLYDDESRVIRRENFPREQFEEALARLDELGKAETRTPFARNGAVRQAERLVACFNARDFGGARLLIRNDFARFDRRHGVSAPTADGADAYMDAARAWFDVGFDELILEPLAVRGESLLLSRAGYRAADGREVMFLVVYELDADGLIARGTHFDEDETAAALDELEDRFLAGEGAPYALMVNGRRALVRALAQDHEGAKKHFAPGFEFVDHRKLSWPLTDAEGWIEMTRQLDGVVSGGTLIVRSLHFAGRAELVSADFSGTTADGSEYAWSTHVVALYDEQGRTVRRENFPPEQFTEALARLDELGATAATGPPDLDNAALRKIMAGGIAPEAALADDVVIDDRRTGVSLPKIVGSEAAVRASHAQDEIFGPTVMEPVAVRGDRLALVRTRAVAESGFELVAYGIFETNVAGQLGAMVFFDESDLAAAFSELDARYLAGEGAEHRDLLATGATLLDATRRDDFDAMRNLMALDFAWVDHGLLGMGAGDREQFITTSGTRRAVSAGGLWIMRSVEVERNAVLAVVESTQITEQGNEYGRVMCIVLAVDSANRPHRMEYFDEDQYSQAKARLHALAATPPAAMPALDNTATAALRRVTAIAARNDLAEIESLCAELCADDVERLDHRGGVAGLPLRGRPEIIRLFHETFTVFPTFRTQPIAVHGERLALARVQMASPEGHEIRLVGLYELDADDRLAFFAHYDESDLGNALAELDRRYALTRRHELAAPMVPEIENAASRSVRALAQRNAAGDIEAAAERYISENYEHVSFRTVVASEGFHSRDAYIEGIRTLFELFPLIGLETIAVRGDRLCLTRSTLGTHSGFEMTTLGINEIDAAGMLVYWASFDEDDLAAAHDHLDERYIAGEGAEHAYLMGRIRDHGRSGADADALRALYASDAVIRNNRRFAWPMTTVEDIIARIGSDTGVADNMYLSSWIDCRGDTVISLVDQQLTTLEGNQYTNSFWRVQHWTAGLIDHIEFFGLENFELARGCFEALAREPRTPHVDNATVRLMARVEWLMRYGSVAESIELMAPDIVERDHRSGVRAADIVGIAAVVANQRALYELLGSRRVEFLAVRGDRLLLAHLRWKSSKQFELGMLIVIETDAGGRLYRTDAYDEDDLLTPMDAMDSRHRELAGESLSAFERLDAHGPLNRRDWPAFEATMSPDFVAIDHSLLNFAFSDRAGFINDQMRTLTEVAPDAVFVRTKIYSSGPVGLFCSRVLGSTIEGNAYEWAHVLVVRLDDDGRAVRHEAFPEDRWTEALALFDEWVGPSTR